MTTATTTDWRERHAQDLMASYAPPLRLLVRGEGCWVWDDEGTKYLDFLGGIAVNSLGHAHPVVVEAAGRQASLMVHVSNYFATPSQLELAERLKRITGAGDEGRVYFGNSGAEANEAAFKLARPHRSAAHPGAEERLPRPHDGRPGADRQARAAGGLPADGAPASSTSTRRSTPSRPRWATTSPR